MNTPRFLVTVGLSVFVIGFIAFNYVNPEGQNRVKNHALNSDRGNGDSYSTSVQRQELPQVNTESSTSNEPNSGEPNLVFITMELELLKKSYDKIAILERKIKLLESQLNKNNALGMVSEDNGLNTINNGTKSDESNKPVDPMVTAEKDHAAQSRSVFNAEAIDDQWAMEMTNLVTTNTVDLSDHGGTLSNIECRSSICQVEMQFNDAQSLEQFILQFPGRVASVLPTINFNQQHHEDGQITLSMFLQK